MTIPKWSEERTNKLVTFVGNESPVSVETVTAAALELETSARSIASKLRKLGVEVQSVAAAATKKYTKEQEEEIRAFVESNAGLYTYAEVAVNVCGASFTTKEIQGKILSMELTDKIKPTPKQEAAKKYSDEEEAKLIDLANSGAFMEDIAEALGKDIKSVRGKCLAVRSKLAGIPKQRESHSNAKEDALTELGDISGLRVNEIAEKIGKTERGVKYMLTARHLTCKNYDGAAKAAKAAEKRAAG